MPTPADQITAAVAAWQVQHAVEVQAERERATLAEALSAQLRQQNELLNLDIRELVEAIEELRVKLAKYEQPKPDPTGDPLPTLTLNDGDTLTTDMLTRGAVIRLRGTVKTTGDLYVKHDDTTVYGDAGAVLLHPGGAKYTKHFIVRGVKNFTVRGVTFDVAGKVKGGYAVQDNGTDTRVERCGWTDRMTRLVNASEYASHYGVSTGLSVLLGDCPAVLGGTYDPNTVSACGVYLGEGTRNAVIDFGGNTLACIEYAVRDMSGLGTVIRNGTAKRGHATEYRAGGVTVRPNDPAADVLIENLTLDGAPLELGPDTGAGRFGRLAVRNLTSLRAKFIQLCGSDDGAGEIDIDGLHVREWLGPTNMLDFKRNPKGTVRNVSCVTTGKPTVLSNGQHSLTFENVTRNGAAW